MYQIKKYATLKLSSIGLACLLWLGLAAVFFPISSYAQAACKDGTPIPGTAVSSERQFDFCRAHGGYASGSPSVCDDGTPIPARDRANGSEVAFCQSHMGYSAAAASGGSSDDAGDPPKFVEGDCKEAEPTAENCGIIKYLRMFINGLSAVVGIVIVIALIVGGIQFSAAADNPQASMAAKKRVGNAVLALLVFIFMFAILQWLIPGGLF